MSGTVIPVLADGVTPVQSVANGKLPVTTNSSGNVAAATATATLAAQAGLTNYLTGFEVTGAGATAASIVALTITGLLGGTATYNVNVPAGAAVALTPMVVGFLFPLTASAANVAIVVSLPSLGAGNTNAAVVAHGYAL